MLALTRKNNESIVIDGRITVTVIRSGNNRVRLGISAPPEVSIMREDLIDEFADGVDRSPADTLDAASVPRAPEFLPPR